MTLRTWDGYRTITAADGGVWKVREVPLALLSQLRSIEPSSRVFVFQHEGTTLFGPETTIPLERYAVQDLVAMLEQIRSRTDSNAP